MESFFLLIYNFFKNRIFLFYSLVIVLLLVIAFLASRIKLEEDISKSVPGETDKASQILKNSKFTNKIIINIFYGDTLKITEPGPLIAFANELTDSLSNDNFKQFVNQSNFKVDNSLMEDVMNFFYDNLPVFLNAEDYQKIDSLLNPATLDGLMERNYNTLISPASFALKKYILLDPIGIDALALAKLKQFQMEEGYDIIDGYIFARNKKNLLIFIDPVNAPSETRQNAVFFRQLDQLLRDLSEKNDAAIRAEYYGAAAVAVGNAEQIKRDIKVTVSVAVLLILLFVAWYFRKAAIPFISFLPAIFGGSLALAIIYLLKGKMSTIALGIGSVLLGIIVDYALYIYSIFKAKGSVEQVVRDMGISISMCSLTSSIAFFSLLFVKSEVLRDLGLFAGLSILGAAVFSLVILPHLLRRKTKASGSQRTTFIDKIAAYPFESNRFLTVGIIFITIILFFLYRKAAFETDMYSMNYLSQKMKEAERHLNRINTITLKSVYIFSTGESLQKALSANDNASVMLDQLEKKGIIESYTNVGSILINDSVQRCRIQKWEEYWSPERLSGLKNNLIKAGLKYGFIKEAFNGFYEFLARDFQPIEINQFGTLRNLFLNDMITETDNLSMIMSLVKVNQKNRHEVFNALSGLKDIVVIDRQEITSGFVSGIKMDFDLLVKLCLIFVTLTLVLSFGRIETGIIASIPMFLSWLWTLGFMGVTGLKFNIFNIIVSTFVFGLGVDYTILMIRGLLLEYRSGCKELYSYKTSIFLSSFTTLIGVGVLLLAKHPSLHSISLISIMGLISVVLISYTLEPVLFNWLILKKGRKRALPVTLSDILFTTLALLIGLAGCIFMNLLLFLVFPLPIPAEGKKRFLHKAMCWSMRGTVYSVFNIRKTIINEGNENFNRPSIIIANHQSHLDLPLLLMLSPKIIVLTTTWVWNNPVYALVIRYLDFYPVTGGYENLIDKLKKKVEEGYSILVFPEGTRSPDSGIRRFHKGAFLLAEKLNLDIVPILIHGAGDCMNKGENHLKGGHITVKIFSRIKTGDGHFGKDYHERTKALLRFFRSEYKRMKTELETPSYFRRKIIRNYIYKGPVLEWYTRIKILLEKNYTLINNYVPREASIVDIGCGYGMMSYMLCLTSEKRNILGIDYDSEKIELAENCLLKNERIRFVAADAITFDVADSDVFLLSDVLHYMPEDKQDQLLKRCIAHLNPGGSIIIRDADKDLQKRHIGTRYTEFFSTHFGYNKALNKQLYFFSGKKIIALAKQHGMEVNVIDNTRFTSNVFYILTKTPEKEHELF